MTTEEFLDNIKLLLTGGIIDLDVEDKTLGLVLKYSLQEIQRYIDVTEFITVPFASCIDLSTVTRDGQQSPIKISSISRIYRCEGFTGSTETGGVGKVYDPMYAQTWMAFTNGGTMYNLQDYLLNYLSYNTLLQMRNTTSTDLSFKQDHQANKLYINGSFDSPTYITIEYVPKFESVEQIKSDYWIDILQRMALAYTKIIEGRIKTRYKQNGAQWEQDGEIMLEEGNKELDALREMLETNSQIIYPMD